MRTAILATTASADLHANAALILAAIGQAAQGGARVLLTPECVLCGYPGAVRDDLHGVDWCALHDAEDALALAAERAGLVLLLGTSGRWRTGLANELLACGAVAPQRYRKRCLTPADQAHFAAGDQPLTICVDGWTIGLGICFDLRFAPCWADLAAAGADLFAVAAHMAGPDPDPGTKAAIIPVLAQARAAEWATPLIFSNTAANDRYCDSAAWDARGLRTTSLAEGLRFVDVERRETLDPWYAALRTRHLEAVRAQRS